MHRLMRVLSSETDKSIYNRFYIRRCILKVSENKESIQFIHLLYLQDVSQIDVELDPGDRPIRN